MASAVEAGLAFVAPGGLPGAHLRRGRGGAQRAELRAAVSRVGAPLRLDLGRGQRPARRGRPEVECPLLRLVRVAEQAGEEIELALAPLGMAPREPSLLGRPVRRLKPLLSGYTGEVTPTLAEIEALEAQTLLSTYTRIPLLLDRGKGAYVFAADGRRYLDFLTGIGVNALGYNHPRITRVIREQAARLIHCSNLYYHPYQGPLAQRLNALAGTERAFFTNSGTEALEGALKLGRLHGRAQAADKVEIVSLDNSFHGRSFGALSVTGQPKYRLPYEPGLPGVQFVQANDRAALGAAVGPRTAAVLLEPIQGEGGIIPLEAEFLAAAADLARQHRALLILDEIQCGLGRTGRPFAFQWTPVLPDIVVTAKPIACGLPLGVILARGPAAAGFTPGMHGTTFGGGPLACRVALEFLDIWASERLLDNINSRGAELQAALDGLKGKQKAITAIRGRGLMWGIELNRPAKPIVDAAREFGLLANATHDAVIRLLPPYNVTPALVRKAVRILARAFRAAKA